MGSGVIILDHSLVLQKVSKTHSGVYTCTAHNSEGDGVSNSFRLNVRCKLLVKSIHTFFDTSQTIMYSVSILYGNIAIFRDLEAFLTQKVVGSQQNLQCTIGICPCFWSRPPGLSWIKRIGFLTFIACQSKTNGCFQNWPAVFSSSFIEPQ